MNIDAHNVDDTTPLKAACEKGHLEIVKLLLAHGARITLEDTGDQGGSRFLIQF